MKNSNKGKRRITFRLVVPEAKEIYIAGDFTGWNKQKQLLNKKLKGVWQKTFLLKPGRYEYKFLVDGSWWLDPSNGQFCENAFGTRNSVIEVGPSSPAVRKREPVVQPDTTVMR